MLRILSVVAVFLFSGTVVAQPCQSYPYALTNGTTADASQVMGNFNHVLGCVNNNQIVPSLLKGWITGLTLKNNTVTPNTVIDIAAGVAASDNDSSPVFMSIAGLSKNVNAAWVVGSSNGCLDTGSSLTTNKWYHLFLIARTDTGVVDVLCSTSATVPNVPSSYNKQRRIGSIKTNSIGSGEIIGFVQDGDLFQFKTLVQDVSSVASPGTAAVLRTISVPKDVRVKALVLVSVSLLTGYYVSAVFLSDPFLADEASNAATSQFVAQNNGVGSSGQAFVEVMTDTSSQIRSRLSASDVNTTLTIRTRGWVDPRGRY